MLAAATTSLPETPRGERNWDYRYCWIRDATFTLWSLHVLGLDAEAEDFARYIADICFAHGNQLQIMYGIGGERDLTESTLDHLSGYGGARPVRIGNGAFDQRQNDVYGALVDSLYIHAKTNREIPTPIWPIVADQVDTAAKAWREPDQGIWEARGEPKHYVSYKLMCWVALDRSARLAKRHGEWDERGDRWRQSADEARRAPSRSAPSGSPLRSRRSASPSRRGRCARSCWRSPARSASTARRSSRAAAPASGTSRRRSRTLP
jgi:alpha,alpha-trehalase